MYGMDFSDNNGELTLSKQRVNGAVPAFVIAKASEGTGEVDSTYSWYESQASSIKAAFGAYHFYLNGGTAEATHFLASAPAHNGLGLFCDYENPSGNWEADAEGLAAFSAKVYAERGVHPGLYVNISDMNNISPYTSEMKFSSLWLAAPSYPVGDPNLPYKCQVHQYGETSAVGGSSQIDLDYSTWTSATWYSFWTA